MDIFSHLLDKDLFAEQYRLLLAKRLLNKRSASFDAEKSVVGMVRLVELTFRVEGSNIRKWSVCDFTSFRLDENAMWKSVYKQFGRHAE